jgi:phytoene dehydrogenase-like protein
VTERHEVVVVGAGHNGLTCAAYLARAGVDVLVLEARDAVGGCASTVAALDGARVNVCNCDHGLVRATGVIEELDLAAHGLRYFDLEPSLLAIPWDGDTPWLLFADVQRTLEAIALAHPHELPGYRRYLDELLPVARLALDMTRAAPTPGSVAARVARHRARGLGALLALSRSSAGGVLRSYFGSEALRGPVAVTGPAVWGLAPDTPRTGLAALGYAMRHLVAMGRPIGGSGALTDALAAAVGAAGGTVRTRARVARIVCAGGRAAGVELVDGTRVGADAVVAAADPRSALVEWLDEPPAAARRLLARWRARPRLEGYESKLDAVVDALPRPRSLVVEHLERLGGADPLVPTAVVAPSLRAIAAAHAQAAAGRVAQRPLMLTNVPSVPDPALRPPGGGHVLSLEVLFTPYRLAGGWADSGEPERWLAAYANLLEPGFLDGVRRWRLVGPEDFERDFSMPAGYAPSFAGGPIAALLGRHRELTRYATPVPGLYLTGSGTFPGAGVSGAPGRNAAAVVLAALRPSRAPRRALTAARSSDR